MSASASAHPAPDTFVRRHLGPSEAEQAEMLKELGYASLDAFIDATVPDNIRLRRPLALPAAQSEQEALAAFRAEMNANDVRRSFIGMGYYDTHVPAVIQRNILENPGWYTAYTPYQAEIAQGRLEALLNYQTVVSDLTGLPIANASLLDEGTAAAEAVTMVHGIVGKDGRDTFLIAKDCHPQTIEVVTARAEARGVDVKVVDVAKMKPNKKTAGVLLQYPNTTGQVEDYRALCEAVHAAGGLVIVATDLLALTLLQPPGEWGADVAVGNSQRFGVPYGFGGPHAAFFATKDDYKRQIPGRIIGVSRDATGRAALRMALQTREQHIRREKATSNVCTAQVLLSVMAGMYAVWHGPDGLKRIANRVHYFAELFAAGVRKLGMEPVAGIFFDTVTVPVGGNLRKIVKAAGKLGINLRVVDKKHLGVSMGENTKVADISDLLTAFNLGQPHGLDLDTLGKSVDARYDERVRRTSDFLTHPTFSKYHSETEMLRYMRKLESRDLSLTHSMIPLGSCTMKLNASAEMYPVTWREVGGIHPFAPAEQTLGYQSMFVRLEKALAEVTGFAAVSLQPNAGSQGEYAGLLVIRAYHRARGQGHRNICLIPQSAHGTNPASAVMAGMQVVVCGTDANGNIDVADLRAKAEQHSQNLAALMVTYPSTHGVFEESIKDICAIIHEHGGQVYLDGANMNAMVGLSRPGDIGADVCHLNLHKTFCIPHGGGGPGMGPIGVVAHLAPYLPGHGVVGLEPKETRIGAVSAAPWGSASILPISMMYIDMMGGEGLTEATKVAILNANYIAEKLKGHYEVLYRGKNGHVAHECILDTRPLKQSAGIEVEDIAKRLMDYGFHAPTVSFPVAGTLMVEPTESESKAELDRFIEALIAIREEIRDIERGVLSREDNPLVHAPHTQDVVVSDSWARGYSRERAAYPLPWVRERKFWPSVSRIESAFGDRNLVCSCPPIEEYAQA
ncbi:aminomethyl-transferring glycine dehydrogenase [Pseudogemmatithrix spongiicola]|uniref:Glycine dehydrogenase (decarboxylating) n=1 Tax=Pseudogemmatithrix spongiicola TaxID=3062599 RepID=A0AA49Q6X5_9BACT|nr:aminomethyl-transferring glycine dehydrogenase [Gemmatimonadaceae bacterium 'strain 138']WKW14216.1 aminomethyl-transferring glycine dehydrogenase [Gemmatimonadaceae bacterium 'strain 318']